MMGGSTITRVANSLDDLLRDMEEQILSAYRRGLWVDSELIVIEQNQDKAKIYHVDYEQVDTIPITFPTAVTFTEVEKGRAFHVGVAGRYGPKPGPDQLVGTIHVHT